MKLDLAHGYAAIPFSLFIVACSSVSGGAGGSGGALGGATITGVGECGPGDLDCICPGGYFECQDNHLACVCPPQCTSSGGAGGVGDAGAQGGTGECENGSICVFVDGYCGRDVPGYCQSLAKAQEVGWFAGPTCGCDGKLYDSGYDALVAGVSPNRAPTTDCNAQPLPCFDAGSAVSCYVSDYCMVWGQGGLWCSQFDGPCAEPSCNCLPPYNEVTCACEVLPSGLVKLTCDPVWW